MLIDTFNRLITYMRVSVTKRCNFYCIYCKPNATKAECEADLPLDKMLSFIELAIDNGIKKIRITGGEPLLRPDLSALIAGIHRYAPQVEIALTTNAFLLAKYAKELKNAGLKRLNISLDSLKAETIKRISHINALNRIMQGIESARALDFGIKLNMVVLKGINDDEILTMLNFARENHFGLRFIEFMENIHANAEIKGLRAEKMLKIIQSRHRIKPLPKDNLSPAKLYEIPDSHFVFGIISPHEDDFCQSCNRIRLTSEGIICPCLYYQDSINLKNAILNGDREEMQRLLRLSVQKKPEKNLWQGEMAEELISTRAFYQTGG